MRRYLTMLGAQLRASFTVGVQYRAEFFTQALMALVWNALTLVPIFVVYRGRESVAGWSFDESLIVLGWFTVMKGILEGAINPSLTAVVEHVRKGTLDFVLLKPADAQFLVSTTKFELWRIADVMSGLALLAIAFVRIGRAPSPLEIATGFLLVLAAIVILYSLWILVISAAFYLVRIDNLSYLFSSIFDAARWPASVFRGALRVLFTFIIPLAVVSTFPSLALLGKASAQMVLGTLAGTFVFASGARLVWNRSLSRYTSASS